MHDAPGPIEIDVDRVENAGCDTRVTRVSMTGSGEHHTFVLVGGVGVAATYFEFLAPTLAKYGDVYALDLPGFAGMPRPLEQPTAAFFADQVENVIAHYGMTNPVLIGHSMGTQVVTEVVVRNTELTHAVLVSPVINEAESTVVVQGVRFAQSAARESFHLAVTAFSAYLQCGMVYFLTALPHMMRYRLSERIRGVPTSILFIRGEYDRTSPRRFHTRLAGQVEKSRVWEIEGASHSVLNAHAVGVAELTIGHLTEDLARRGRMPSDEAEVPTPKRQDLKVAFAALRYRASEWVSAIKGDDAGVARAKSQHARLLWKAYAPSRAAKQR